MKELNRTRSPETNAPAMPETRSRSTVDWLQRKRVACLSTLLVATLAGTTPSLARDFQFILTDARMILDDLGLPHESVESKHYHVLYVGRRNFAEQRKTVLEATRRQFLGFMRRINLTVTPMREKLLVILLDTQDQMRRFAQAASDGDSKLPGWVAGYYDPERNWSVFYNQRKGDDIKQIERNLNSLAKRLLNTPGGPDVVLRVYTANGPVNKSKRMIAAEMEAEWARIVNQLMEYNAVVTQHEGAHQLAYNTGVQNRNTRYPFWVSEGLACVFEVPPSAGNKNLMGAGRVNADRLHTYRSLKAKGKTHAIRELVPLSRSGYTDDIEGLYAESWALFSFLFTRHGKSLANYMAHLAKRGTRTEQPTDEVAEFEKFFKVPVRTLQRDFERYIDRLKP